ncbi:MAG: peptidylprolyl isomerase [Pseudomonadota bacterium]|nr:peptidylprolyl isomerase [Pseudomonadota bacterium]
MTVRNVCLALLFVWSPLAAQAFGPAVTVNGVEITRAKVRAQVDHMINQRGLNSGGITQPAVYQGLQQEVVEQLVTQELLWQEAQRRDFIASAADVDKQLEKMKRGFDTEQAFLFKIKEGGFTEATYREEIRQQRSVQRMVSEGVAATITITDEEISVFYKANIDRMSTPEQVRARHILIKLEADDDDARKAAREKIVAVQQALQKGENFALLAKERSEGPSATKGGDLGFFGHGQMVPPFEEAAFALQPGEISDIVETRFGFHIIKLEERHQGHTVPVEEASGQIRQYLKQQQLQATVEKFIEDLRAGAEIENALTP